MVDGNWLFILVPQTEHLMCGTQKVGIMHDGLIKVLYEDGTIEERMGDEDILAMDADNPSLFKLVGYVQEGR